MNTAVNVDGTKAALDKFFVDLQESAWESLGGALESAEQTAKSAITSQTKTHSGKLLGSFDRFRTPHGMVGRLINRADYAKYIDEGTRPHTIRARNTRFLRFTVGGTVMYRTSVNHPGTKPRPFVAIATAVGVQVLHDRLRIDVARLSGAFNR